MKKVYLFCIGTSLLSTGALVANYLIVPNLNKHSENISQDEKIKGYSKILGEVNNVGEYGFYAEDTLFDLVSRAGGLTDIADVSNIDLSIVIESDNEYIIPSKESGIKKININTATVEEIYEALNHYIPLNIVKELRKAINEYGRLSSLDELGTKIIIKGIGEKRLNEIKKHFFV